MARRRYNKDNYTRNLYRRYIIGGDTSLATSDNVITHNGNVVYIGEGLLAQIRQEYCIVDMDLQRTVTTRISRSR